MTQHILSQQRRFVRNWELGDSTTRSILKTISWRLTGSGATLMVSYFILGNIAIAGTIAFIQLILNTILYYLHERIWNRIIWGKNV